MILLPAAENIELLPPKTVEPEAAAATESAPVPVTGSEATVEVTT